MLTEEDTVKGNRILCHQKLENKSRGTTTEKIILGQKENNFKKTIYRQEIGRTENLYYHKLT